MKPNLPSLPGDPALTRRSPRPVRAFTLIEMLVVIGIIVIVMAIALPNMRGFQESHEIDSATRQLISDLSSARARAINGRTTVGVIFIPYDLLYSDLSPYNADEVKQIQQLQAGIYTHYAFFSFRRVGDQPGHNTPRYLSPWKELPSKTFIAENKFAAGTDTSIPPFDYAAFRFPSATSPSQTLPYVAFNYEGRPCKADGRPLTLPVNIRIPLARGAIFYTRDASGGVDPDSFSVQEVPPGNSVLSFNHVVIDWLTGKAHLERAEVK